MAVSGNGPRRKLCAGSCGRVLAETSDFFRARLKNGTLRYDAKCKKCVYLSDTRKRSSRQARQIVHRPSACAEKAAKFETALTQMEERFGPYYSWGREAHEAFSAALRGEQEPELIRIAVPPVDYASPFFR